MPLGSISSSGKSASAIKAGEAFVEISAHDKFTATLNIIGDKLQGFGAKMAKIGAGITAAGAGILAPILGLFDQAIKRGDEASKLANRIDSTVEAAERLKYAFEINDSTVEAAIKINAKFSHSALLASKGMAVQAKSFETLGMSTEDFLALDPSQRILAVSRAFDGLTDAGDRYSFLFGLMGDQLKNILPLLSNSEAGIRTLFERADMFAITGEDAARATEAADAIDDVKRGITTTLLEIGFALIGLSGSMRENANTIMKYTSIVREWMQQNRHVVLTIAAVGVGLVVLGGIITTVGIGLIALVMAVKAVIAVGSAIIAVVLSPIIIKIALVVAAVAALTYAFTEFTETGQKVKGSVIESFDSIKDSAISMVGGIVAAIKKGDIEGAWEIVKQGVKVIWMEMLATAKEISGQISNAYMDFFDPAFEQMYKDLKYLGFDETAEEFKTTVRILHKDVDDMLKTARDNLADEKTKLAILIAKAKIPAQPFMESDPIPYSEWFPNDPKPEMASAIARLGEAVRGTFASSNYAGSLGIGPPNRVAEDSLDELQRANGTLDQILKKVDVSKWQ